MSFCIFCKIANHEIPGKVVYEDDLCMAFLDLSQATDGHTLVVPKEHYESFLDVNEDTLAHIMKVAQKLALMLKDKLDAKGFNIITNANEVAGQSVKHFHVHIIPRYEENEGFAPHYTDRSSIVNLDEIYNKIMK